ncbi:MAG: bis(5'-nucleosyl)-tetraphosphatase (symmetrical) YqeK, partial [Lachnospiraceae bacterium]|nr:bis(5'-nucleosyl)-tetraphosphatase (symmetrical) YqeK [Lachnospiraceae bacterium]
MWKERYKQDLTTLRKQIRKERLIHTEGVAYTAAALAMAHGADMDDAFLAGLLHDCGKGVPEDERIPFCERAGIPVTETERANTELLHAKIGAWYAKTWYFVKNREVLDAIAWHTTGHPGMGLLE